MDIAACEKMNALLLLSCLFAGSVLLPDAHVRLSISASRAWTRARVRLRQMLHGTKTSGREPFWQIDMTKFEP